MSYPKKPFVTIDAEILGSTIWREEPHVRLLWLTMLILCDLDGYVGTSLPGLADTARLTIDQTIGALKRLSDPDEWSRTKTNDGRRIEEAERGWKILNFVQHIDRLSEDRRKTRERVRMFRARRAKRRETHVTPGNVTVRPGKKKDVDVEGDVDVEQRKRTTTSDAVASGARAPRRPRQMKLTAEGREPFIEEAGLLVKAWVYLVVPATDNGVAPPPTPGLIDSLVRLDEARYSKPQRVLVVVAASTERYFREMRGLRGLQSALSLGGRPRVKDGVVISHAKNQAEGLLNEPRRYGDPARKVLAKLGALDEATARGWRPE